MTHTHYRGVPLARIVAERDRLRASNQELLAALDQAAAGLAIVANHAGAKHPGCADQDNLQSIRGFALECFHEARYAARTISERPHALLASIKNGR